MTASPSRRLDLLDAHRRRRRRKDACGLCAQVEASSNEELVRVIRGVHPGWPEEHARGCPAGVAADDLSDADLARLLQLALADDPSTTHPIGDRP